VVNDTLLQSFERVEISNNTLLPGSALDRASDKRCEELARAVNRLGAIDSQDGLILLRSAFSARKVHHLCLFCQVCL